jgi:hypothetical protein
MGGAFVFQRGVIPGLPCLYKMVVKRVISVWARVTDKALDDSIAMQPEKS